MPQISTIRQEITADTVIDFLSSKSDEWWKIEEILQAQFHTTLDLSLSIANLSGGELTKLFLAIGLSQEPNLLLLDEPTNHMDLLALENLRLFLLNFSGAYIIVSHKPFLLDQVTEVSWELTPEGVKVYGGKSTLAKAILGMEQQTAILDSGEVLLAPAIKAVYLDQTYELVNRQQTILENMQAANPNLSYQLLRQQLGHFLFKYDDVHKPASVLNGGELARLAIAIISISEIDLLILDEPTNNLDIETVEQMIVGINEYQGALWVISHDLDFLSRINITQGFKISKQTLQMTNYLPSTPELYYQELLKCLEIV